MAEQKRNRFGLTDRDMETIRSILKSHPEIRNVELFGSRAKGNYRLGSDVDLAIMNEGVSGEQLAKIRSDFEDSSLPYNIDLVDFTRLEKQEFINHIERVGIPFYTRDEKIHVP
ncbi:nucleotidyltransferase domain-containing protein [soil metagenome]